MNYRKLDYFLLPFTFLSFIVSLYILIEDQFISSLGQSNSIAEVVFKTNTVKTKSNSTLFWINTNFGDYLGNKDQIYAHKNSEASIKLRNGSTIKIGPNTLISLDQFNKEDSINVEKGFIVADLGKDSKSLKLKIGDKVINLSGNNSTIQISKLKGKSTVSILKGEVSFTSKGRDHILKKGQFLSYTKISKDVSINNYKIELTTPAQSHIHYSSETKDKIHFEWSNSYQSLLQISKSPTFKHILFTQKLSTSHSKLSLAPGSYYWRVTSGENQSITRNFKVVPALSTTLDSPNTDDLFILAKKKLSIALSWQDSYHDSFEVELSLDGISKKVETSSKMLTIQLDKPGSYKWKVRPSSNIKSNWSKERTFVVSPPYLPSPPRLSSPMNREQIILFKDIKNEFRWGSSEKSEFEIEISNRVNFDKILFTKKSKENYLLWRPKNEGLFFWRVRPIDLLGRDTAFSKTFEVYFTFHKDSNFIPKNGTKISLRRPNEIVDFKWKKESKRENKRPIYLFEVSKSRDFSNLIIVKKLKSNVANITFKQIGTYYWRTKIQYSGSKAFFGKPQKVTISPTPPPKKPTLEKEQQLEIKVNDLYKSIKKFFSKIFDILIPSTAAAEVNTSVQITWTKVPDTKSYLLEIYSDEFLKNLVIKESLKENKYIFENVSEGTFYYRIATIDFWERISDFSDASILHLSLPTKFKKVARAELKTPSKNTIYKSSKAYVDFSWKGVEKAKKYILRVSKSKNFKTIYLKRTLDKNSFRIRLSKGFYYWKVQAINQFDYKSYSRVSTFEIKPSKPLIVVKELARVTTLPKTPTSLYYFQYDLLSSSYEQSFTNYQVLASDVVYTSFEFGLNHRLKSKKGIHSKIRRFTGKVFNEQSYGVTSLQSQYFIPIKNSNLKMGIGLNFNSFKSYKSESNVIIQQSNSSLGLPLSINYSILGNHLSHLISLNYSLGSLKQLSANYFLNFHSTKKNYFSVGGEYEKLDSKIENSEMSISNIKGSFRYNITY
ncbi:hypothetical protein A9Q84_07905 [Halobacteriovorax marinus]|mgnify:CR=1 FL=1|uniref:FecR protein domain-containing protein n=1 Tax=Halobacteriovorax marinus TaxID=97084 RepID=A0A1Y5F5V6_9BACT|nr:hypothetical protein A9Q84_07905 [Halobacteriovorax marinus]